LADPESDEQLRARLVQLLDEVRGADLEKLLEIATRARGPKKKAGRPKGSVIRDNRALAWMAYMLKSGRAQDDTKAARLAVQFTRGASTEAIIDRLCRKMRTHRPLVMRLAEVLVALDENLNSLRAYLLEIESAREGLAQLIPDPEHAIRKSIDEVISNLRQQILEREADQEWSVTLQGLDKKPT